MHIHAPIHIHSRNMYMHPHIYTYSHTYVYLYIHARARVYTHLYTHTYVYLYIRAHTRTHAHTPGLVLLDDIHLNADMDRVWGAVAPPACKYDLSDWGHSVAGTGLIDFACRARFLL